MFAISTDNAPDIERVCAPPLGSGRLNFLELSALLSTYTPIGRKAPAELIDKSRTSSLRGGWVGGGHISCSRCYAY